jgi:hypothetical protein
MPHQLDAVRQLVPRQLLRARIRCPTSVLLPDDHHLMSRANRFCSAWACGLRRGILDDRAPQPRGPICLSSAMSDSPAPGCPAEPRPASPFACTAPKCHNSSDLVFWASRSRGAVVLVDHAADYLPALHERVQRNDGRLGMIGWPLLPGLVRPRWDLKSRPKSALRPTGPKTRRSGSPGCLDRTDAQVAACGFASASRGRKRPKAGVARLRQLGEVTAVQL